MISRPAVTAATDRLSAPGIIQSARVTHLQDTPVRSSEGDRKLNIPPSHGGGDEVRSPHTTEGGLG